MMNTRQDERFNSSWYLVFDLIASRLTLKELKCTSVVNMNFFNSIKHHIGNNYPFRIPPESVAKWFTPKRIVHWCMDLSNCGQAVPINAILHECHHPHPLSPHITHLILGIPFQSASKECAMFNHPYPPLPQSLTYLSFGIEFNQPVDNLPPNIKELEFKSVFNQPVNHLPTGLTHLTLGRCFNHPVDHLPSSLLQLRFDTDFNQPLDHLPPSLKDLQFYEFSVFNHPLDNLPASLTNLNIPLSFSETINILPRSLINMEIYNGSSIATHPDTKLRISLWPPALKTLKINRFLPEGYQNLPSTIHHLSLKGNDINLFDDSIMPCVPRSVTHLEIARLPYVTTDWNVLPSLQSLSIPEALEGSIYPPTLTELNSRFLDISHGKPLPPSITRLSFNSYGDLPLTQFIPPNITHLTISGSFGKSDTSIDHLPATITHLVIPSAEFNKPVDHLPPSLLRLTIRGSAFNQPVNHLPSSLLKLTISSPCFNYPVDQLPPSLTSLHLGQYFSQPLLRLPQSLSILKVNLNHLLERGLSVTSLPLFVSVIDVAYE